MKEEFKFKELLEKYYKAISKGPIDKLEKNNKIMQVDAERKEKEIEGLDIRVSELSAEIAEMKELPDYNAHIETIQEKENGIKEVKEYKQKKEREIKVLKKKIETNTNDIKMFNTIADQVIETAEKDTNEENKKIQEEINKLKSEKEKFGLEIKIKDKEKIKQLTSEEKVICEKIDAKIEKLQQKLEYNNEQLAEFKKKIEEREKIRKEDLIKKEEPNKVATKKVTPKTEEPNKIETKKITPKTEDSNKVEPKKVILNKKEPNKVEPKKVTTKTEEPDKVESKKDDTKKVEPKGKVNVFQIGDPFESGNDYEEYVDINQYLNDKKQKIDKIYIDVATQKISVIDDEGKELVNEEDIYNLSQEEYEELLEKSNNIIYEIIDEVKEQKGYNLERNFIEQNLDANIIYSLAYIDRKEEIKDYIKAIYSRREKLPFNIEYNLKDIQESGLDKETIKDWKKIIKTAVKQNGKKRVNVKKDNILEKSFKMLKHMLTKYNQKKLQARYFAPDYVETKKPRTKKNTKLLEKLNKIKEKSKEFRTKENRKKRNVSRSKSMKASLGEKAVSGLKVAKSKFTGLFKSERLSKITDKVKDFGQNISVKLKDKPKYKVQYFRENEKPKVANLLRKLKPIPYDAKHYRNENGEKKYISKLNSMKASLGEKAVSGLKVAKAKFTGLFKNERISRMTDKVKDFGQNISGKLKSKPKYQGKYFRENEKPKVVSLLRKLKPIPYAPKHYRNENEEKRNISKSKTMKANIGKKLVNGFNICKNKFRMGLKRREKVDISKMARGFVPTAKIDENKAINKVNNEAESVLVKDMKSR